MKKRPERVVQMLGKTVPLDYFLYSCLERERMTKHIDGLSSGMEHWPPVAHLGTAQGQERPPFPESLQGHDLKQLIAELDKWYHDRYPELGQRRQLTFEILIEIIGPFVMYTHDLATLVHMKTGQQLPPHNSAEPSAVAFWADLRKNLQENFPEYAAYFERYLEWAFAAEVVEKWELGSRPPVGKYAPPLRLRGGPSRGAGGGRERGRPEGDRPPRQAHADRPPSDRPARNDRPPREDRDDRGPRSDRGPRGDRGPRSDRGPRGDRGPRSDRGARHEGSGGGPSRSPEKSKELEDAAMADVNAAIEQLQKSPNITEILLKPANSFYRRLQHQHAVDLGFVTNSVGEGSERTVKISRE